MYTILFFPVICRLLPFFTMFQPHSDRSVVFYHPMHITMHILYIRYNKIPGIAKIAPYHPRRSIWVR